MTKLSTCPWCGGDRVLEYDKYGWYLMCLLCGHVTFPDKRTEEHAAIGRDGKKAA